MATDHTLELRRAVLPILKADAILTALVGARIYDEPPAEPAWPFIRYGEPILGADEAMGWSGGNVTVTIHAFAKARNAEGTAANGKEVASRIGRRIALVLDEASFALPVHEDSGRPARALDVAHQSTNIIRDTAEAGAWHAIVVFEIQTAEAD
jgi:hypothetical protein